MRHQQKRIGGREGFEDSDTLPDQQVTDSENNLVPADTPKTPKLSLELPLEIPLSEGSLEGPERLSGPTTVSPMLAPNHSGSTIWPRTSKLPRTDGASVPG